MGGVLGLNLLVYSIHYGGAKPFGLVL